MASHRMASAKDESAPCETDRRLFDDPHVVLSGQRPDVQDAIAFEQMQPLTLVGFTETGGFAGVGLGGEEFRRNRLAVVLVGHHHDLLLEIHRHIVVRRKRKILCDYGFLGEADAGMVAGELGDGFVHALISRYS